MVEQEEFVSSAENQVEKIEQQFQIIARQSLAKERLLQQAGEHHELLRRQIEEQSRQLQERDEQLREQSSEHNRQLEERDRQLRESAAQLQESAARLEAVDQIVLARDAYIHQLLTSRAFRIGSALTYPVRKLRAQRNRFARSGKAMETIVDVAAPPVDGVEQHSEPTPIVNRIASDSLPARETGTIAVGVVTFNNSPSEIARLVRSVEIATGKLDAARFEIEALAVDNGAECFYPRSSIHITRRASTGNVGFGRAMNDLMRQAFADVKTEWFLCLNPDGVMHHGFLAEVLASSNRHPSSLIEGRQFPEEHVKHYDPQTLETPWASGACLLIRRRIYEAIGGFDPHFFMYLEDVDYSWRARAAGFSVKVAPNALLSHAVTHRRHNPELDKMFLLSGRYLAHKWHNANFLKWTEQELVKRRYFSARAELPTLPTLREIDTPSASNSRIADFDHYFNFSPARW